jgi:PAS domain S-box-containing protein
MADTHGDVSTGNSGSLPPELPDGTPQPRKTAEDDLRRSEERMRWSLQGAGGGVWDMDLVTGVAWWSEEMYPLWGVRQGTEMVMENSLAIVHENDRELVRRLFGEAVQRHADYRCEFRIRHPERGERWMVSLGRPILNESGHPVRLLGISLDITERKLVEHALQASEERLRIFIEHAPASIAMFDRDMRYVAVSNRWMMDYHLGDRSIIGISHYEIFPEITDRWKEVHKAGMMGDVVQAAEDRFDRADGTFQWLRWEVRPWHLGDGAVGGIIIMSEDITERKLAENTLITSLREKEVMLKEIHHRVKNNLQVVSSLLSMQANSMQDPQSRQALFDSRNRVRSMSLVHERLYRSQNLASIDFGVFLQDVTGELHRSYHVPHIRVRCDVDPIQMEVDTAIPCGLIVNELVSNALKHGFPDGREGTVSVALGRTDERHVSLTVDDDGIGLPSGTELRTMQTMGMTLVQALVAQIDGKISLRPEPGAHFTITFPA